MARIVERMVAVKVMPEMAIDEPKFLNDKMLKYPETAIATLINESKYLYKNSIFEIVAHGLNIHREDIKSDLKVKKVIKRSREDMKADVRELYLTKVKNIYGEIIRFATRAQSTLKMKDAQNNRIMEIKLANRKMVEIIRDVQALGLNVTKFLVSENKEVKKMYDGFRRKVIKVLRVIYLFRTEEDQEFYSIKLKELKEEADKNILLGNKEINKLIREDKIKADTASSLVNDHDNVNSLIKNLIEVAELLYGHQDPLVESGIKKKDKKRKAA